MKLSVHNNFILPLKTVERVIFSSNLHFFPTYGFCFASAITTEQYEKIYSFLLFHSSQD